MRLRDEEGLTAEEIAAVLEQFKKRVRIVAVVDSPSICRRAAGCRQRGVGGRRTRHQAGAGPAGRCHQAGGLGPRPPRCAGRHVRQLDTLGGVDPRYGYTLLQR